jgi:hydrogenase maturation protease
VPETVIIGVEPQDIDTLSLELTPVTRAKVDAVIDMVLTELDRLGVSYKKGKSDNVSGNSIKNYKD